MERLLVLAYIIKFFNLEVYLKVYYSHSEIVLSFYNFISYLLFCTLLSQLPGTLYNLTKFKKKICEI